MWPGSECPLCLTEWEKTRFDQQGRMSFVQCQRCGPFAVPDEVVDRLKQQSAPTRRGLLRWLDDQHEQSRDTPVISVTVIDEADKRRATPIAKMADSLLSYCVGSSRGFGDIFSVGDFGAMKAAEIFNYSELRVIARYLEDLGYVQHLDTNSFQVTAQGYARVESGEARTTDSFQAFVAMWFDPALNDAFENGFRTAVARSGHAAFRIDRKEHANKIDDEIIAEIRKSKFLVADFTGHRGGVYFEAGFAQGIGIPVIWTCREDALAGLHFDIRQYNCIAWTSVAELATALERRIVALIGQGPLQAA